MYVYVCIYYQEELFVCMRFVLEILAHKPNISLYYYDALLFTIKLFLLNIDTLLTFSKGKITTKYLVT